ncbi:hypothetical protein POWCR01_060026800 [Plasmodium ovale]|uniref:Uncharacterized protein n=1 Tax=Plasmodium ovale TaxID=36330 RepID=A0A1C3KQ48_PLAOA|nr:hypothetical protein POWCR01_060026800 [Plasmodium ovale]
MRQYMKINHFVFLSICNIFGSNSHDFLLYYSYEKIECQHKDHLLIRCNELNRDIIEENYDTFYSELKKNRIKTNLSHEH